MRELCCFHKESTSLSLKAEKLIRVKLKSSFQEGTMQHREKKSFEVYWRKVPTYSSENVVGKEVYITDVNILHPCRLRTPRSTRRRWRKTVNCLRKCSQS